MDKLNHTRLDLARRRRGLTIHALTTSVGLSRRSWNMYSKNERIPSRETVLRLARELRFPEGFFYGDTLIEPPDEGASFRALSTVTTRLRKQALAAGALGMHLSNWIDGKFRLPAPDIQRIFGLDPEEAAMEIRNLWGLGEQPILNIIPLLESQGVRIFSLAEETAKVDAYSFWHEETPFMFLNTMKSAERNRMDAAHELGHLVLHWKGGSQRNRWAEKEAQLFGSSFLMPRSSLLGRLRRGVTLNEIIRAKRYWVVSVANLTHRLYEVNLLTEYQYRALFREIGKDGYRVSEPDSAPREQSQILEKVFRMLLQDGLTSSQVAKELTIYPDELGKLLFKLVRLPVLVKGHLE